MTWRDYIIIFLVWLGLGLMLGPIIGRAIKTMRGDEE